MQVHFSLGKKFPRLNCKNVNMINLYEILETIFTEKLQIKLIKYFKEFLFPS